MATLGEQAIGSIVKLNVSGVAMDFIVIQQGLPSSVYDSSCNDTWLLMNTIYVKSAFDSTDNDYANSDLHNYLNSTFLNLFDRGVKNTIKQAKLPYTNGNGPSGKVVAGADGIPANVFLLSYTEVGLSGNSSANIEGAALAYFKGAANTKRVAKFNGTASAWWLRSPATGSGGSIYTPSSSGSASVTPVTVSTAGVRPAIIMPSACEVDSNGFVLPGGGINGAVNIGGSWKELSATNVNVGGVWKEVSEGYENIGGVWKPIS